MCTNNELSNWEKSRYNGKKKKNQTNRDSIQFNGPSQKSNYIFCNHYSKCHIFIELCCDASEIFKQNWQNKSNKYFLDTLYLKIILKYISITVFHKSIK